MVEVALNGLMLDYRHSGTAVYTRNLVPELVAAGPDLHFRLFVRQNNSSWPGITSQKLSTHMERWNRGKGIGARLDKLVWEAVSLPAAAAVQGSDLLHSLYFAAPPMSPAPLVVTIHDLIPLVLPQYYRTRQSALYSRLMAATTRRASAIITVSHHSKLDIMRVLDLPSDRIHVVYEAADRHFTPCISEASRREVRQRYDLPNRFFLYLGGAERRKNVEMLIRAWAGALPILRAEGLRLVIVANFPPPDRLFPDVDGLTRELDLVHDIQFVREVDERDKPALYASAAAFCYPSLYEGFGLPPLEAMACGTPVVAAMTSSIPEVVGDSGWLLPPDDVMAWSDALKTLAQSGHVRADLAHRGLNRSRTFSWRATAEQTVGVYRRILSA